jgi:hypothetical protein
MTVIEQIGQGRNVRRYAAVRLGGLVGQAAGPPQALDRHSRDHLIVVC